MGHCYVHFAFLFTLTSGAVPDCTSISSLDTLFLNLYCTLSSTYLEIHAQPICTLLVFICTIYGIQSSLECYTELFFVRILVCLIRMSTASLMVCLVKIIALCCQCYARVPRVCILSVKWSFIVILLLLPLLCTACCFNHNLLYDNAVSCFYAASRIYIYNIEQLFVKVVYTITG